MTDGSQELCEFGRTYACGLRRESVELHFCKCSSTRIMSVPNCGILRAIVASKIPKEVGAKRFRAMRNGGPGKQISEPDEGPVHFDRDYRLTRSQVDDTIQLGAMPNY